MYFCTILFGIWTKDVCASRFYSDALVEGTRTGGRGTAGGGVSQGRESSLNLPVTPDAGRRHGLPEHQRMESPQCEKDTIAGLPRKHTQPEAIC